MFNLFTIRDLHKICDVNTAVHHMNKYARPTLQVQLDNWNLFLEQ